MEKCWASILRKSDWYFSDEKFRFLKKKRLRFSMNFAANLVVLGYGTMLGHLSPALPLLMSEESPLETGPLTTNQLSWVGSINSFSAMIGSFIFSYFITKFGPKRTMISLAVPSVVVWLIIYFGNTYYHLLVARLLAGMISSGIQLSFFLYVSEIANDT